MGGEAEGTYVRTYVRMYLLCTCSTCILYMYIDCCTVYTLHCICVYIRTYICMHMFLCGPPCTLNRCKSLPAQHTACIYIDAHFCCAEGHVTSPRLSHTPSSVDHHSYHEAVHGSAGRGPGGSGGRAEGVLRCEEGDTEVSADSEEHIHVYIVCMYILYRRTCTYNAYVLLYVCIWPHW